MSNISDSKRAILEKLYTVNFKESQFKFSIGIRPYIKAHSNDPDLSEDTYLELYTEYRDTPLDLDKPFMCVKPYSYFTPSIIDNILVHILTKTPKTEDSIVEFKRFKFDFNALESKTTLRNMIDIVIQKHIKNNRCNLEWLEFLQNKLIDLEVNPKKRKKVKKIKKANQLNNPKFAPAIKFKQPQPQPIQTQSSSWTSIQYVDGLPVTFGNIAKKELKNIKTTTSNTSGVDILKDEYDVFAGSEIETEFIENKINKVSPVATD